MPRSARQELFRIQCMTGVDHGILDKVASPFAIRGTQTAVASRFWEHCFDYRGLDLARRLDRRPVRQTLRHAVLYVELGQPNAPARVRGSEVTAW